MNGIELAESLQASMDIPFIYLTSNSEDETIASAKIYPSLWIHS